VKRTATVTFCVCLVVTLGLVLTRVIAARVPEQRATLEKLITDRTGLAVRFDNVHFAWNLDGTSAVFTRVELTDPKAGRVRVVAPELRVEFDAWDFLRHRQFSLGHVTLSSPDIEIIGDPEESVVTAASMAGARSKRAAPAGMRADEESLVRQYLAWAALMPNGRIEVEGARVHLLRRGDRVARRSFTLSEAVVSRGGGSFSAYGTMLLSQDVGQSLFVSAKLEGLEAKSRVAGDLRVIARRVFLDKLQAAGLNGRGTIDAKLRLRGGRVESASWQASARELELNGEDGTRFDHLSVNGTLTREANDVLLDFTDLQLTRGARLERAPRVSARLRLQPGSTQIARTTVHADRVPFMATEFIAGLLAPQLARATPEVPGGWTPSAGELRALNFDSGDRGRTPDGWVFSAHVVDVALGRAADHAELRQLAARVHFDARELQLMFDPANPVALQMDHAQEPRTLALSGRLVLLANARVPALRFEAFSIRSGASALVANGNWNDGALHAPALNITVAELDHAQLQDVFALLALDSGAASILADIEQGRIVDGELRLQPSADARAVNWQHSSGRLSVADLATSGKDMPQLTAGRGALNFARGGTQLTLNTGKLQDLAITAARLEWPHTGTPRLHLALNGALSSPLLRAALRDQGLERLDGEVSLEADARGEQQLREPALWRVTARVSAATVPLAGGLPPVENLAGTIRYSARQLRGLTLVGSWLGGPVEIESRRAAGTAGKSRGITLGVSGVADAAPLLRLLGQAQAAGHVDGQLAWTASAQQLAGTDGWQLVLASNLAGVESRLPEPFDKTRARQFPVRAELRTDADGIREFLIDGRELLVRGQVRDGLTRAHFEVQGASGELMGAAGADPQIAIDRLDLRRAPGVLAAATALLPVNGELTMTVADLRYSETALGALHAAIARRDASVEFSLESPAAAVHRLTAHGECSLAQARCRAEFTADTAHLASLTRGVQLPAEWPAETLHAAGELSWASELAGDITRSLTGTFDLETQGSAGDHQLTASATLADGQILLSNVQGTGPAADQVFRGNGRVGLLARDYDLTVDYEKVSLAATAMPTPARARFARMLSALRGSVARRGWTEAPESRRVQWHGSWE
jgi:uncharacterized protein YhdP